MHAEDGSVLWAWQVQEADGRWGVISMAYRLGSEAGPQVHIDVLVHRSEQVARRVMGPIAASHHKTEGKPIRLARLELAEVHVHREGTADG